MDGYNWRCGYIDNWLGFTAGLWGASIGVGGDMGNYRDWRWEREFLSSA